jgi:hypothetical protein
MRPYLITAKLMRPSNMKRFPTPELCASYRLSVTVKVVKSTGSQLDKHEVWMGRQEMVTEFWCRRATQKDTSWTTVG